MYSFLYLSLTVKYWTIFSMFENRKLQPKYPIIVGGLPLFVLADLYKVKYDSLYYLFGLLIATALIFSSFARCLNNKASVFFFSFATVLTFDESIGMVFSFFLKSKGNFYKNIIPGLVSVILLFLLYFLLARRIDKQNQYSAFSVSKIYLFSGVFLVAMLFPIAGFAYVGLGVQIGGVEVFIAVCCMLALLSVCTVIFFFFHLKRSNDKLIYMVQEEEKMKNIQKVYYETLLSKEKETKQFRHDIQNHYMSIRHMVEGKEYDRLAKYIAKIGSMVETLREGIYNTGNPLLDALLTYYLRKIPEGTEVSVVGKAMISIDEADSCIIFSNLIKNAVEELDRIYLPNIKKFINIKLEQKGDYVFVVITNAVAQKKNTKDVLKSQKGDNHGWGIKNVREAMERVGGVMDISCNDKEFGVTLVFRAVDGVI